MSVFVVIYFVFFLQSIYFTKVIQVNADVFNLWSTQIGQGRVLLRFGIGVAKMELDSLSCAARAGCGRLGFSYSVVARLPLSDMEEAWVRS